MDVKIFRINYKSDFILTLNSDAGWMTPFCIKFWTGAPSQAYFVGWDGETYTHCAYDPTEPTKLVVQFDDHHLPIGDLKFQIAYHFTVDDFPNDVEDEVLNQSNIVTEIDGNAYQVMLDFTGETAPEIQFSLPAYANEAQRIVNEQQRIAAEETRIDNEAQRIQNEETRINQEQARQDNEAQRIRNEQTRINQEEARVREFATLKRDAQESTTAANNAAALANQKAQLAADKAQLAADKAALAQDAANLANQKAQLAADKAALAQDAADLANQKAQLAQQKAEYAQSQGDYAKQQGDYAKEQGDYAKRKGDDAAAQMQQQAQAFSEAQAARQTSYEQAEGTESGSVAGDGSRWGAFKTNEAARDAKVDAKVADITNLQEAVAEGAVYDVSAKNPTAGPNNDGKWESLSALLSDANLNTLIPSAFRRGGMSIKFVLSSDNKYVQYRLMSDSFNTTTANWQGVDDKPTAGSNNLVKSGGVALSNSKIGLKNNLLLPFDSWAITEGQYVTYYADTLQKCIITDQNHSICYIEIPIDTIDENSYIGLSGFTYTPNPGAGATYTKIIFFDNNDIKIDEITVATNGVMIIKKPVTAASCFIDVPIGHKSEINVFTISEQKYNENLYKKFNTEIVYPDPQELIIEETRDAFGSIYIRAENWRGRVYKTFDKTQSEMAEFLNTTLVMSPNGLPNCIEIKNTESLVIDTINSTYLAIKSRENVLPTDIILISCTRGRVTRLGHGMEACAISAVKKDIDNINLNLVNKNISISSCTHGSIQPDGGIATKYVNCLTSPFIEIKGDIQIYIPLQSVNYNGEKYLIETRIIGTEDINNTGAHMISNHGDFCPKLVQKSATDKFIRMSIYFYHIVNNTRVMIDSEVDALDAFADSIFYINIPDTILSDSNSSIVDLNKDISDVILPQFKKNIYSPTAIAQSDKPLVLLDFSDLHSDSNNLKRLISYYDYYKQYIDDILFTGDGVANDFSNSFDFWNANGAENVLFTIGNHDTASYAAGSGYDWTANVGINAYNKYLSPNIQNWNVIQPSGAASSGLCYYYKDYAPNIRLIVLDDMSMQKGDDTAQVSWFESVLNDARNNSKCVLVAAHYPNELITIDCPFTGIRGHGWVQSYSQRTSLVSKIDDFISAGGKFIAWITGHLHRDMLGKVNGAVNNQLNVGISTASCNNNQSAYDGIMRVANTKSADLFNIVKVDTYEKIITLYRVGSDFDTYGRHIGTVTIDYENCVLLEKH